MGSEGEVERGFLRLGGLAGILAGVLIIIAGVLFLLTPQPTRLGQVLEEIFPQNRPLFTATTFVLIVALLLFVAFAAALYWSLQGTPRGYALLGLGLSLSALALLIVQLAASHVSLTALSRLYGGALAGEAPLSPGDAGFLLVAHWTARSLLNGLAVAGSLFLGTGIAFFGVAMRGSADFSMEFAWLSVGLGALVFILVFLGLEAFIFGVVAVFVLALGWKVYALHGAA